MYLLRGFCVFLFLCACALPGKGMQDTTIVSKPLTYWQRLDSIQQAKKIERKRIRDSIQRVQDSLQMLWIKRPDAERPNQFVDSLKALVTVSNGDILAWWYSLDRDTDLHKHGTIKHYREPWMVGVVLLLMLFFGILKNSFSGQLQTMFFAFYNDRALLQISKEDNLYNSWPFVLLYILFGFTLGLLVYLANMFLQPDHAGGGPSLYLLWSVFVLVIFTIKIVALRLLGFLFEAQRLVRDYVSILYLSYFNTAILFLPLALVAVFLPPQQMRWILIIAFVAVILIFSLQFLRGVRNALKTYRFPKFYLFLYFCTLEIGPIVILIKILGF